MSDTQTGEVQGPYRSAPAPKRVRVHHLREMKERGERWPMLTAYDVYTAEIFDEAGIPVLLVGDSAGNNVFGYDNTIPVTVEELLPLVKAVVRGTRTALVVADLPFGSYQLGPEQALTTSFRFMKEAGAHAVKLEGGARFVPQVEALTGGRVPESAGPGGAVPDRVLDAGVGAAEHQVGRRQRRHPLLEHLHDLVGGEEDRRAAPLVERAVDGVADVVSFLRHGRWPPIVAFAMLRRRISALPSAIRTMRAVCQPS